MSLSRPNHPGLERCDHSGECSVDLSIQPTWLQWRNNELDSSLTLVCCGEKTDTRPQERVSDQVSRYFIISSIQEMLAWTPYCPKDKRLSSLDNRVSNLAVISMNFKKIKLPKIKELIGDSSCEISFKNINSFSDKIEEINQVGQLSVHAGRTPVQPAWTYVCPEWIGIQPAWTYVCPLWTYLCPTSNFIETKMCLNFSHHANTLF